LLNRSYVFIIGAGGSEPYGFPLGDELYNNIRDNYAAKISHYTQEYEIRFSHAGAVLREAEIFTDELKRTSGISIDKYLNINSKFKRTGIHAIFTEILTSEVESKNHMPNYGSNPVGDWYTYLYKKLTEGLNSAKDLLNINQNKISFITFNYDRSLEHFLFENLFGLVMNAGISRKELLTPFSQIPIIHVYGKLAYLPWEKGILNENDYWIEEHSAIRYGNEMDNLVDVGFQLQKQNMIEIMYEERKEKPELIEARRLISNAEIIIFLGFGYDQQNLSILQIPKLLERKAVFGTALGATKNEIVQIKSLLNFNSLSRRSQIYNCDCLMLLREHLI
jgi:hypothetical protein